jgi:flagellar biosynthesis repressor protein FlbT
LPLKLKLAPGERIVVNGAVMTNGHHGATLTINNHAAIMREGHILQEADADTPTKRAYFLVQAMLLAPPPSAAQEAALRAAMAELRACYRRPTTVELLDETQGQVDAGNFYKALSALRRLIDYEAQLLRLEPPQWRRQSQAERHPTLRPTPA